MTELPQVRCIHLHSKAMAVYGEAFESDPDFQAGLTDFWCLLTAKGLGPDEGDVGLRECCDRQRGCYQEY
jgi:hypothetical protein